MTKLCKCLWQASLKWTQVQRHWLDFWSGQWKLALWVGSTWERISSRILKVNRGGLPSDPKGGACGEGYKESGRSGLQEGRAWENWRCLLNSGLVARWWCCSWRLTKRGELRELTGTGARAEVEGGAKGRKAESSIMSLRFSYNEKRNWGKKEQCQRRGCWGCLVEWGARGRQEVGSALSVTWQGGSYPGETSAEEMPRWFWKGVWTHASARMQRRKESESKWSIICANRWEAGERGRKLLGCPDRQLSDSQDKCLGIRAQGESAPCKHTLKNRLSHETF